MKVFLSFAELLRRWATSYIPPRATDSLLGKEATPIVGDIYQCVEFSLEIIEISPSVLDALGLKAPSGTAVLPMKNCFSLVTIKDSLVRC
jgi:hypothetical protein